jgi:hypothetical protein
MSHPAADGSTLPAPSDGELRDPSLEAAKVIDQARIVLASVQAHADETSRILAEITRIGGTFDAVANHLLDSTFRVTDEATRAVPSRLALVKIVEELGHLARVSLAAAGDTQRELRNRNNTHQAAAATLRTADLSLQDLSAVLTRLAARPVRSRPLPAIEIETLEPPTSNTTGRPHHASSDLERVIASTGFGSRVPKSGGYKN